MSLFVKKSLSSLLAQAGDSEKGLKRTLTAGNLVALGIGAIIGAGLFVRTALAAGQHAGPAVTLSFIIAAIGCAFAVFVMQNLRLSFLLQVAHTLSICHHGRIGRMGYRMGFDS
jgi:L-asparagine transporter-like permease